MNCKPGDMAIIVRADDPRIRYQLGLIVEVTTLTETWDREPAWWLKTPIKDRLGVCRAVADCDLRPIRNDPGNDETLQWVPIPHKEAA